MIEQIRQFFKANLAIDAGNTTPRDDRTLKLTTAALLIEVSLADFDMGPEEKASIINTLRSTFELSALELDSLVKMAEQEVQR